MIQRLGVIGVTACVLMWFPYSPASADEKVLSGLTEAELQKSFDQLRAKWYPTTIKGYAQGKESRYDITWQTGDPGWYLTWGMTAAEFAKHKTERAKKGFKVTVETKWTVEGQDRIAAICARNDSHPGHRLGRKGVAGRSTIASA